MPGLKYKIVSIKDDDIDPTRKKSWIELKKAKSIQNVLFEHSWILNHELEPKHLTEEDTCCLWLNLKKMIKYNCIHPIGIKAVIWFQHNLHQFIRWNKRGGLVVDSAVWRFGGQMLNVNDWWEILAWNLKLLPEEYLDEKDRKTIIDVTLRKLIS